MDAPESRYCAAVRRLFDEKIYAGLNNKQKEAVYCVNGPLLVLAGAGSGKTTVLVNRISHIIRFGDLYNVSAGTGRTMRPGTAQRRRRFDISRRRGRTSGRIRRRSRRRGRCSR